MPGDVCLVKLGDVMPADCILLGGHGSLQMDQAALTGESLPVNVSEWGKLLMGSAVKRGEALVMVSETGLNTFFGKAAGLIASVKSHGHLQTVLLRITVGLLFISVAMCAAIFARLYTFPEGDTSPTGLQYTNTTSANYYLADAARENKGLAALSVMIVILVASIPIAIEVVCTSTLAVGSHRMAEMKVIVARLSAIEELASMTILCSDKTGTLTQNKLGLRDPICFGSVTPESLNFFAYLASKKDKGSQDAIDFCIGNALTDAQHVDVKTYSELHFEPFNPTDKRTLAKVRTPDGSYIEVSKGAPQVILKMSHNAVDLKARIDSAVQQLGDRGFRSLGVGINRAGEGATPKWEYLGVLSLFDPPRHDTKQTIESAHDFNIEVKMVTGDHAVIARETCRELSLGTQILNTDHLGGENEVIGSDARMRTNHTIRDSDGFAEVMPEHKFMIVERLRELGFVTGMTGDGVNDAPALKRADVGIAVEGATDAARAAADLVLTEPGLSVIIDAIFESRKIFQRMRNYIVYRIACTIQLLFFFFFAIMAVNPDTDFMYGTPTVSGVSWWSNGDGYASTLSHYGITSTAASTTPSGSVTLYDSTLGREFRAIIKGCTGTAPSTYSLLASSSALDSYPTCKEAFLNVIRDYAPCVGSDISASGKVLAGHELCHATSFTLPVIAMVIITVLNDGCMITISNDFVVAEKRPQTWDMLEMWFIAGGLGLMACISSLILVAYLMHANASHPGDFMGNVFGSSGRNYVSWYEVRTIIYLKVSISDFLTLFSARTHGPFYERALGRPLAIAAAAALTCSTLLSLFWGDIFASLSGSYMESLRYSKGAVLATWLYCILWWFVQDVFKILSYHVWNKYFKAAIDARAPKTAFMRRKLGLAPESDAPIVVSGGHGHGEPLKESAVGLDMNAIKEGLKVTPSLGKIEGDKLRRALEAGAHTVPLSRLAPLRAVRRFSPLINSQTHLPHMLFSAGNKDIADKSLTQLAAQNLLNEVAQMKAADAHAAFGIGALGQIEQPPASPTSEPGRSTRLSDVFQKPA